MLRGLLRRIETGQITRDDAEALRWLLDEALKTLDSVIAIHYTPQRNEEKEVFLLARIRMLADQIDEVLNG
ncbi:MAG TPA: hypothetical protein VNL74_03890 [Methylococcus sp.]|nr:hypothetical protein [Methylococcus sp.]